MKCPHCDIALSDTAKFCQECGAPLAAAVTGTSPPFAGPAGDRRLVTILFADLSGFTALSETLDPEAVRDLITAYFDRLVPCIHRYGGTVDKFMGDEVMALFGAPRAHEDDPERALRAALEMREALEGFDREHGVNLALHFGVNTGLVYAGGTGGGGRQDYSVLGDAVNVAARLKAAATSGEILVGADTYRHTRGAFLWEAVGPLPVKGKAEPLSAYRLLDGRGAASTPGPVGTLSSPQVGREGEQAALAHRLGRAKDGEGGGVIITGEAGLGKSRLVAEARGQAERDGFTWLEGRTLSFGRTLAYWPFIELIQQDAGMEMGDAEGERWAKLAGRTTTLFAEETPTVLPYLATLLSLPMPEELAQIVRRLDGAAMGRHVYRATRRYFARLAQERPTVLVFEDVHWLDGSSAALIEHFLPLAHEVPIVFCLVGRPEAESVLSRLQEAARAELLDRLVEITLAPLTTEQSARLVHNLVPVDDLPRRTRDLILARAEGNPFFLEEVVRSLVDMAGLIRDPESGRWQVIGAVADVPIPDTLHGVIMARVDLLEEDAKRVLRLASVVGRSFLHRVLAAVAQADEGLDESLALLEARDLIQERTRTPELEYIFKHTLVQEVTYESILLKRRRELHARVARAIEALFPDRREEFLGFLAYHYTKAEAWAEAQACLLAAGRQAGRIAADPELLAHFEHALEAHLSAHGGTWGELVSDEGVDWFLEWTNSLAEARRLGSVASAVATFHENLSAALGSHDDRVMRVAVVLGRAHIQRGVPQDAVAVLEDAMAGPVRLSEGRPEDLFRALVFLGGAYWFKDAFSEAEATLLQALDLLRSSDPDLAADCGRVYVPLSAIYRETGRWDEALRVVQEGLGRATPLDHLSRELLLVELAQIRWALGDYPDAEALARMCAEESQNPFMRAAAEDTLGLVLLATGSIAAAERVMVTALHSIEAYGSSDRLVEVLRNLAQTWLQDGRLDEAERAALRALSVVEDLPEIGRRLATPIYSTLAGVALSRGRLDEAGRLLTQCDSVLAGYPDTALWRPEILYLKARLCRRQGRDEEAEGLLEEACRLLDERRQDRAHPRALAMHAEWARTTPPGY